MLGLDKAKVNGAWVPWSNAGHIGVQFASNYTDNSKPELVDRFPSPLPILYVRAKTGAAGVAYGTDGVAYPTNSNPAYDARQLVPYNFPALTSTSNLGTIPTVQSYFGTLANYDVPRQRDGFMLIAAGADRLYGTMDDETNTGTIK